MEGDGAAVLSSGGDGGFELGAVGADLDEFFEECFCGWEFVFFGDAGVKGGEVGGQNLDGSVVFGGDFGVGFGGFDELIEMFDEIVKDIFADTEAVGV